eukprot:CAMPEP_0182880468 /NCGR_PEP_ID=MMETSP0034_2-20130328/16581_1 /TAXON_ID=156128 /ORGANISM="Nephroselmis pyriformis, Strain CCMP717" /LENGTH=308 /DNA_ID=CAMNT_0025013451 /DNA_START=29 /DNA_END=955 /DNA_ORIENTATION=+
MTTNRQQHLFRFGIVADVQYADKEDNNGEGRTQRYREAPGKLKEVVARWKGMDGSMRCVLQMGDIVDGNADGGALKTREELEEVAAPFDELRAAGVAVHHALGNHCLAHLTREVLLSRLAMPASYYEEEIGPGWRLLVLDTTELSLHSGYPQGSQQAQEAEAYMAAYPPEEHDHIKPWNGGICSAQMAWLVAALARARAAGERVVVATHHPVGPGSCRPSHHAWNYGDIAAAIEGSGRVALVLSGHDHLGGYCERAGVHYLTLPAVLEAPPGGNAFGHVDVFEDRLEIAGSGTLASMTLPLGAAGPEL